MIRIIAAIDRDQGIAKQGVQPWSLPADEQYFMHQTQHYGATVLMGKRTYEALGRPLPGRTNYVLTTDQTPIAGVTLVHDLEAFMAALGPTDLWVVGGASIYEQLLASGGVDELYLTKIEASFGCDQFFPTYDDDFKLAESSDLCEQNGFLYTYNAYVRRNRPSEV